MGLTDLHTTDVLDLLRGLENVVDRTAERLDRYPEDTLLNDFKTVALSLKDMALVAATATNTANDLRAILGNDKVADFLLALIEDRIESVEEDDKVKFQADEIYEPSEDEITKALQAILDEADLPFSPEYRPGENLAPDEWEDRVRRAEWNNRDFIRDVLVAARKA